MPEEAKAGACAGRKAKRPAVPDAEADCRAVRLKWVQGTEPCSRNAAEGKDRDLVLQSFELVPLPASAVEAQPDPELSIAAATLLANIAASSVSTTIRSASSPTSVIITATVPLVEHITDHACMREVLKPVPQERVA